MKIKKVGPLIIIFLASLSFNLFGQVMDDSSEKGWLGLYYINSMIIKDTTNILLYMNFLSDSSIKIDGFEISEISEYTKEDKRIIIKGSMNDTFYLYSFSQERMVLLVPYRKTNYVKIIFYRSEPVKLNISRDSISRVLTSKIWKLNSDIKQEQLIEFSESGEVYFNKEYKIRPNPTKWFLKKIAGSYFIKLEDNYGASYLKLISMSNDSIEFSNIHSGKNVMYEG